MSEDAVRAAIFSTLLSEFPGAVPGVNIVPENQKYDQSSTPWIYLQIVPTRSERAEISSRKLYHHFGVASVLCMIPPDTGTKKMWQMADAAFSILGDRNWSLVEGKLTTFGAEKKNRGLINGYYTATMMVDYRLESPLVRP